MLTYLLLRSCIGGSSSQSTQCPMQDITFQWGQVDEFTQRDKKVVDMKAATAEFVALTLFVMFGCGTACMYGIAGVWDKLMVAFAFGMAIMILVFSIGHHSGGQINCAVTLSMVLGGALPWYQGVMNFIFQLLGSLLGAVLVLILVPCERDMTTTLATNKVDEDFGIGRAFLAELIGTFFLCYVVWETAIHPRAIAGNNAAIAIGFTVFVVHLMLLPIDGCSINPTRSFGPALIGAARACPGSDRIGLQQLWLFFVAPLLGGIIAAMVKSPMVRGNYDAPTAAKCLRVEGDEAEVEAEANGVGAAAADAADAEHDRTPLGAAV